MWNVLAAGLLILTCVVLVYYILIGFEPASSLNLFPPSTPVVLLYLPTLTQVTPWPTLTPVPTVTATRAPGSPTPTAIHLSLTATPEPSPTQSAALSPTARGTTAQTPTVAATSSPTRAPFPFTAMLSYQIHPVLTCDWTSVAGTAVDLKGQALRGYVVQVTSADRTIRQVAVGDSPDYGPGGWEVRLGGRQAAGTWLVQLYAANNPDTPVSQAYEITMPGQCQKNLAFVRFQQNH